MHTHLGRILAGWMVLLLTGSLNAWAQVPANCEIPKEHLEIDDDRIPDGHYAVRIVTINGRYIASLSTALPSAAVGTPGPITVAESHNWGEGCRGQVKFVFLPNVAPVSEDPNTCGPGAVARALWPVIVKRNPNLPPEWDDVQDLHDWLVDAMGTTTEGGTDHIGFLKGKNELNQVLGGLNNGEIELVTTPFNPQPKKDELNENADLSDVYDAIEDALNDPNKVVEMAVATWGVAGLEDGHCFTVTGLDRTKDGVVITGRDDEDQTDWKAGADKIVYGPFGTNGKQSGDEPMPKVITDVFIEEMKTTGGRR